MVTASQSASSLDAQARQRDPAGRFAHQLDTSGDSALRANVDARKRAYLAALEDKGTVREACELLELSYSQPYIWASRDPEFGEAFIAAKRGVVGWHEAQLERLGAGDGMPAVTANFGRLRNLDPAGWSPERQAQAGPITVQVQVLVNAAQELGITRRVGPALAPALPPPPPHP